MNVCSSFRLPLTFVEFLFRHHANVGYLFANIFIGIFCSLTLFKYVNIDYFVSDQILLKFQVNRSKISTSMLTIILGNDRMDSFNHSMVNGGTSRFKIESTISRFSCSILFLSYLSLVRIFRSFSDHCSAVFLSIIIDSLLFWYFTCDWSDLWFYASINNSSLLFLYLRSEVTNLSRQKTLRFISSDYSIGKFVS